MEKFILLVKGGSPDESNREETITRWKAWLGDLKEKDVFDSLGYFEEKGKNIVGSDMSVSDYVAEVGGYVIVKAADIDAAVEIAKDTPSLTLGGSVGVHAMQKKDL